MPVLHATRDDHNICRVHHLSRSAFRLYARTGRRFFTDEALEHQFLARPQSAVERSGLWDELATDWLYLDCELMPWSAKAQELLQKQYAPVGNAGVHALRAESELITKALLHVPGLELLSAQTAK